MALRSFTRASFAMIFCLIAVQALSADLSYLVTDLGDLTSDRAHGTTFPSDINNKGAIVGQSFNDSLQSRAFLWEDGHMSDLGELTNPSAALQATAINKKAQVIGGNILSTGVAAAFYGESGALQELDSLQSSGGDTYAWSINNHGDIVGAGYTAAGELHALRWVKGIVTELGASSDGRVAVQAFKINGRGQIVGYLSGGAEVPYAHAFLWQAGVFADLGTLPGTTLSIATAVNERGQVIGQSYDTNAPDTSRAFLWDGGVMLDLGMPATTHDRSEAHAINKDGTAVGMSGDGVVSVAWIWSEGVMTDLNALVVPNDPNRAYVQLTKATGINDRGEIVAQGIDSRLAGAIRGYLLTPVGHDGKPAYHDDAGERQGDNGG